jgi:SPP1 gp7 family putative phage head morphogenesis protein
MEIIEEYNRLLRAREDEAILTLHKALDASHKRILRRVRYQIRAGQIDKAQRNLALLQEFRQLIPVYNPDKADAFDKAFQNLALDAQRNGVAIATELVAGVQPGAPRIDVKIPLEASFEAAKRARGYLERHGQTFAQTASQTVAQGIAEGSSFDSMIRDLQFRLKLVKHRATMIARTESLRAYNEASKTVYTRANLSQVLYYATSDDRTCPWCRGRAGNIYQLNDITVPLHVNCVLGDTQVTPGTLIAATRAIYYGDVVTIRTADGHRLRVTENHPVATPRGWVGAGQLHHGDKLLCYSGGIPTTMGHTDAPNFYQVPTKAEEVFNSFRSAGGMLRTTVPTSPVNFHGDGGGCDRHIEVVYSHRELALNIQTGCELLEDFDNFQFIRTNRLPSLVSGASSLDLALFTTNAATGGMVGLTREGLTAFRGSLSHPQVHSLRASAWDDPAILEPVSNRLPAATELLSHLLYAGTPLVKLDKIVSIEREHFGHGVPVYDFTTKSSTYIADGVFTHNCRCYLAPWDPELATSDPAIAAMRENHIKEMAKLPEIELTTKPAPFESIAPQALE